MKRLLRFVMAGIIGTTVMFAAHNRCTGSAQSQSQSSSSAAYEPPSTSPGEPTSGVFKVCGKKTPPPCAKPPRAVFAPNPEYPEEARKANYRGFSTLKIIVGT